MSRVRFVLPVAAAFTAMLALGVGCGSSDSTETPEATAGTTPQVAGSRATPQATAADASPQATAAGGSPVGVIALGHSGLTGYASDPNRPEGDARENSWATGTSPEVNSVYRRLVAVRPENEGHVANLAEDGSGAGRLVTQAQEALRQVPAPALVIIQTIDNDIRCDGNDDANVSVFGELVAEALQVITEASPDSKILIVSSLGRPAQFAEVAATDPTLKRANTGTGMCDFFNESGDLVEENVAALTAIVESYEAEQERVCGSVPQCSTDGGAFATYQDSLEDLVPGDWHLTVHGHARVAELIWPTVAALLGLS